MRTNLNLKFVISITLLALILRFAFNFYYGFNASPGIDGIVLDRIAYNLATGHGYSNFPDVPTAKKPPVFILIISLIYKIFGMHNFIAVRILLVILSSITPLLVYLIARNITGNKTAETSALLAALSPLFIYNSWWFLSNTFMYFILALGVYFLTMPNENQNLSGLIIGGFCLGLATISIQYGTVFYLPIPFIWGYLIHPKKWIKTASIITLAMITPISFWMIRNYKIYHKVIYSNTESGVRFWGGNNPKADGNWVPWIGSARFYSSGIKPGWGNASDWIDLTDKMGDSFNDLVLDKKDSLNESEINDRYFSLGLKWIKNNPADYFELLFKKSYILWHPFSRHSVSPFLTRPFRDIAFLFELFIVPFFFLGVLSSLTHWKDYLFLYLLIGQQILITLYHFGDIQQRLRIGNYVLIFSAVGMHFLETFFRKNIQENN